MKTDVEVVERTLADAHRLNESVSKFDVVVVVVEVVCRILVCSG